jgi:hypothetical protein
MNTVPAEDREFIRDHPGAPREAWRCRANDRLERCGIPGTVPGAPATLPLGGFPLSDRGDRCLSREGASEARRLQGKTADVKALAVRLPQERQPSLKTTPC